ncbi:hypothetical protein DPMN_112868 [Dreissena polymorpha]|uniref:Uncharacterized protein n=1 Tax=Dreissena polymorpha TaxID=45954 RepID=A0A9D4KGG5_DREPO|nr:hypothetical protein DPMN_112868 [Dreissena polymorpha]
MGLAHIYRSATLKEAVPEATLNKISWVKDKVFHTYYQINPDDRYTVTSCTNEWLV